MATQSVEIGIVGAGVIGLATALRLAADGREVMLIDPNEPGSGASYGNAGTLADYAVTPVGNPALLRQLPQLLLDPESPFALRWSALWQLAPWLTRFVHQSLPGPARANAVALSGLLAEAMPAWEQMAAAAGIADLLRRNGCLYLFNDPQAVAPTQWAQAVRRDLGVRQEVLTPTEVAALEPNLPPLEGRGLFFPGSMHVSDPGAVMRGLFAAAEGHGVVHRRARVTGIAATPGGVHLTGPDLATDVKKLVIAAGARSKPLARQAGNNIPLETERGYHIEFETATPLLGRPVCPTDRGFYMTPMAGRLRVAGTVELGGLEAPLNSRRTALLERGIRTMFPGLGKPTATWLGFRPSLPDSRPVIGCSRASADIVYAFGHGHLGLTLAAVTARLVAELIAGRGAAELLTPFAPGRFG